MSKNLNSELKKEESYTSDPSKHGVEGLPGALGRRPYGERLWTAQITLIICYQIELAKLNIYETLTYSIHKMCCTISFHCFSLSSTALSTAQELRVDEEVEVLVCHQA
jgi:hypothetical protein